MPLLHADADCFYASVVMRSHPRLRTRPMAVVVHHFIASANYPARARGVRGGATIAEALRVCPELELVDVPRDEVEEAGDALFDLFHRHARAVEPGSIEEAFLDVGAADSSEAARAGTAIRAGAARELGLPVSIGVGRTKLMAKLASRAAKPDGLVVIDGEQDAELRRSLAVDRLWGVGGTTLRRLESLGVRRLGDLDSVLDERLQAACGTTMSRRLRRMREGTDDDQVRPVEARTALTAEGAIAGYARPDHTTDGLVELCVRRACTRAGRAGLVGSGITVVLRSGSGAPITLHGVTGDPTADAETWLRIAGETTAPFSMRRFDSIRVTLTGLRPIAHLPPTLF
ncbi:DNA polymerase IV [Rathayibacter sp. VKM Ac-2760]|uniref:Y-family DNA polymerase n=1 Tax=Rathayibacter sp. VKM Ac-2760 TaxID=2609253 RepID=UPI001317E4C6|nr:DNA polymerase IV [Rathayibacter sp. VKM Ac-2760]QHC61061.1 DNA polymerase IV [Rathayibacter sp. VKM Ac-2760]